MWLNLLRQGFHTILGDSVCDKSDYVAQYKKRNGKSNYLENSAHTCILLFMYVCDHNCAH